MSILVGAAARVSGHLAARAVRLRIVRPGRRGAGLAVSNERVYLPTTAAKTITSGYSGKLAMGELYRLGVWPPFLVVGPAAVYHGPRLVSRYGQIYGSHNVNLSNLSTCC